MDRESVAKLRLDRRLAGRRGWIAREELERELEQLPDAADKISSGAEEAGGPAGGGAEPAPAAPSPGLPD